MALTSYRVAGSPDESTPEPTEGLVVWPEGADGDLPLGGVFYGAAAEGEGMANSAIALESSRRLRVERSGDVVSVRFQNRVLTDENIADRCEAQGPDSVWCSCAQASLDQYTCGYILGSSYSVGNGGLISVELREDDGSGRPREKALGRTESYVPMERKDDRYLTLDFERSVRVEAGRLYHLVYLNDNPPRDCAIREVPKWDAASCPRDAGAVGLNGVRHVNGPARGGSFGPYRSERASAVLYRREAGAEWTLHEGRRSFYELGYADGVAVGESYHALDSVDEGEQVIEGEVRGRQRFTVRRSDREVDGVWLNFGHTGSADGSALQLSLKAAGEDAVELAQGRVEASERCLEAAREGGDFDRENCRDWGYAQFDHPVSLAEGSEYVLELSASDAGGYELSTYQGLVYHGFQDRNEWNESLAEVSTDGGEEWGKWTAQMGHERDMALLFTIVGMPRVLE